ncbi:MAG: TetR/AcrR family transcriptional regulator [Sandaracinaceae bacterium]|nr:TetR/AcrR family transcriptional regulator [Sandaracinaceae bacterium]
MSSKEVVGRLPPERPGQPGGKRDRNRRKRLAQLREAGLRLFLEHGVERVTIDDIAKEAGTAKGNFYRYFEDKPDLVAGIVQPADEALRNAFDRCEAALEEAYDEATLFAAYQTLAIGMLPLAVGYPDVVRLYLQESRAPSAGARAPIRALADHIRERAVYLTRFAVDQGLLSIRDPRISALAVVGAVEQLTWSFLSGELDAPPDEIARTLISLVLSGIRS